MRLLPALVAGPWTARLPVSDAALDGLAVAALGELDPPEHSRLVEQLQTDPPLLVWAACRAWATAQFRPDSPQQLVHWLLDHLAELLLPGEAPPQLSAPAPSPKLEHYATQVQADLERAELAAQLAATADGPPRESAILFGLLGGASQWLTLAADDEQPPEAPPVTSGVRTPENSDTANAVLRATLTCLPPWLGAESAAGPWLEKVAAILEGHVAAEPSWDLAACRQRAEEGRHRWQQSGSALAGRLPHLLAKISRLEALEHRFQETLESEKLQSMAELAAGAGHEINNPLAIIAGRAQLLMAEETDPERRRELAVVNAQVRRAHEMIADMRLFARPPQPEPSRFDLLELVEALTQDLAAQGAERGIRVERTGAAGPLEMEADRTQLEVALRAMAKNALESIGRNGRIQIDVGSEADQVRIRVVDDGPGLLPEHRRHLFDPFYSARQAGRGLGLGLSKCWRIVRNHGGRIDVDSQPGKGACFSILLPRKNG